jgi:hypothetical protein
MGLLRRVLGFDNSSTPVEGEDYWAKYDGTRKLSVVGESNYQEALMRVSGGPVNGEHRHDCTALLVLEPDNSHDPKAVMVQVDGECVGYLSRHNARRLGQRFGRWSRPGNHQSAWRSSVEVQTIRISASLCGFDTTGRC